MHLSLVIPAHNEAQRLGPTLDAVVAFLGEKPYRSEVLVVLDGCTDGTKELVLPYLGPHGPVELKLLEQQPHRGKGFCVRRGMLAATGKLRAFTDADLSYPLPQLDALLAALEAHGGVAIASRVHVPTDYQSLPRRLVTWASRQLMKRWIVPGVPDTQAGLKAFTREAAEAIFPRQRLRGFGFDAELLHLAQALRFPIHQHPATWQDQPGSRVRLRRDVPKMALEVLALLWHRARGHYALPDPEAELQEALNEWPGGPLR